ncbi:hypothetical protein HN832_05005 [archaeon]|mgnify:FL=1|jgi:hypothetical protein|nr:hypothetical protein [archaeon]MBT4374047.1 hypothetical protein [archaeon]MBT4532143.1 hypothetical protein [archaeon]MBT7282744.1 hypothetical protein [archaeon]
MNKKKVSLKRDFEIFSKGVQRLEELKAELNALDTKGFESDVAVIKSKLKNVSEISNIEKKLKQLKIKISLNRNNSRKRATLKVKAIHSKINRIEDKLEDVEKNAGVRRKIKKLENDLKQKSLVSSTKNSINSRKLIEMQKELILLQKQAAHQKREEKRKRELLKRIDPSVDITVNEMFGFSLEEIKSELSKKIKNKETDLEKNFRDNIEAKEQEYKLKGNALRQKYHDLYSEKVNKKLEKEIQKRFNKLLKIALKKQKVNLSKEELRRFRKQAQKEFDKRRLELRKSFENNLDESKQNIKQHYEEELLLNKHMLHKKFEQEVGEKIADLNNNNEKKEKQVLAGLEVRKINELNIEFKKKQIIFEKQLGLKLDLINKQKEDLKQRSNKKSKELRAKIRQEEELVILLKQKSKTSENLFRSKLKNILGRETEKVKKLSSELKKVDNKDLVLGDKLNAEIKKSATLLGLINEKNVTIANKKSSEHELKKKIVLMKKFMAKKEKASHKDVSKVKTMFSKLISKNTEGSNDKINSLKRVASKKEKILNSKIFILNKEIENTKKSLCEKVKKIRGKDIQLVLRDRSQKDMRKMIESFRNQIKNDKVKLSHEIKRIEELHDMNLKIEQDYNLKEAKLRERLENEKQREIHEVVNNRVVLLRKNMEREFDVKLRQELEKKEAALQQKKLQLEQEIQEKAKLLFK